MVTASDSNCAAEYAQSGRRLLVMTGAAVPAALVEETAVLLQHNQAAAGVAVEKVRQLLFHSL